MEGKIFTDIFNALGAKMPKTYKPVYFLFDAYDFNYRLTYDLEIFFSEIPKLLIHGNAAIIISQKLLGQITLDLSTKKYPIFKIFKTREAGEYWFNKLK